MNDDSLSLTSSHWGAYRARARNGRIAEVVPFERDPNPSPLLRSVADAFDHPNRIRRPAIRKSWLESGPGAAPERRGVEPFIECSWDQALDLVAADLERVRRDHGNSAIFGGSYGWSSAGRFHHAKTQLARFLNCFDGFVKQLNNYSVGTAMVILPHVVGDVDLVFGPMTSWRQVAEKTELLVAFGGLPAKNMQVESGGCGEHTAEIWLRRAAERGVKLVNISPIRDDISDELGATWHPIVPGTDTAMLLGLAHTLLVENLYDHAFVERYCVGFEIFAKYLREGRAGGHSADWAAGICKISADDIRNLARQMVSKRSFVTLSLAIQRADFGEQPYWAALALAAMIGQVGLPGGGVGFGYGADNAIGKLVTRFKSPVLPIGVNHVPEAIPVARIADLLLRPGELLPYDGSDIRLPHIRLVYWAGGNPFHHHQDINNLVRAWQRPETIIVHESWWTATARFADIVLPATTTLERNDIGASSSDRFIIAMKKVVEPFAEARHDHDILAGLAERLGILDSFTERRDERAWLESIYQVTRANAAEAGLEMPAFSDFWDAGFVEFPEPAAPFQSFAAFREDPVANPLATPSGRIELFSERIASFGYDDCPGHPTWLEPREWLGAEKAELYPLHLISNQPRTRLHGQLDYVGASRASKIQGREPIRMHPLDAAARQLREGDIVRVSNDRGACLAGLTLSDALRPGVVQLATGAWYDPLDPKTPGSLDVHGNPNVLTHDLGTSKLSGGPAAHSVLVQIERFEGELPPIKVDRPPNIISDRD